MRDKYHWFFLMERAVSDGSPMTLQQLIDRRAERLRAAVHPIVADGDASPDSVVVLGLLRQVCHAAFDLTLGLAQFPLHSGTSSPLRGQLNFQRVPVCNVRSVGAA